MLPQGFGGSFRSNKSELKGNLAGVVWSGVIGDRQYTAESQSKPPGQILHALNPKPKPNPTACLERGFVGILQDIEIIAS